jgi:hypothetical protein
MNEDTRFLEYLYSHEPRRNTQEEQKFLETMACLHRASRDPTYEKPECSDKTKSLYIFPYGSEMLRRTDNWQKLLPSTIREDLFRFFDGLWKCGLENAFLRCADGKYVECKLVK